MTTRKVQCPRCNHPGFPIIHSQAGRSGLCVYRKRECPKCHHWASTEEILLGHHVKPGEKTLLQTYRTLSNSKRHFLFTLIKLLGQLK